VRHKAATEEARQVHAEWRPVEPERTSARRTLAILLACATLFVSGGLSWVLLIATLAGNWWAGAGLAFGFTLAFTVTVFGIAFGFE